MNDILLEKLKIVPKLPGCYLWKNKNNNVIYVGKAKNLFNRVHQYFDKNKDLKTSLLVNEIYDIEYIIVDNNNESLILENNLIKKYWPKYNILLKDSSYYPYILVTNDKEPKLYYTRQYNKINGKYYGPLADTKFNSYEIYKFLNEISPFDKNGPLKNQVSIFMQMYLDSNKIQSVNTINKKDLVNKWLKFVDDLFNGKSKNLNEFLLLMEKKSVERLDFEHAKKYKDLLTALENLNHSQVVELIKGQHADYFCYWQENDLIVINVFNYLDGKLISKYNSIHKIYNDINETICNVVIQYYNMNNLSKKIIISLNNESIEQLNQYFDTKFTTPITKTDREIMNIGIKNAQSFLKNNLLVEKKQFERTIGACDELAKLININSCNRIEMFDNSNINLVHAVSGMVSFLNGLPDKKEYRKYKLKHLENNSDFHYMQQVIYRRYKYLKEKQLSFPDLIIVDGGKIQVNAALESLARLDLINQINLIGLKKNQKHQTDAIVLSNGDEIKLDKKSGLYMLLCNIQNEVHRYAISFYKSTHSKSMITSFIDEIKGLGEKSKRILISNYPNIEQIKKLNREQLEQILNPKKVDLIIEHIKNMQD